MILVDQIVHCIHNYVVILVILVTILTDTTLGHYLWPDFCLVFRAIANYGLSYAVIGGFGIALYRFLYVHFSRWFGQVQGG